jgi:hypothetical protein
LIGFDQAQLDTSRARPTCCSGSSRSAPSSCVSEYVSRFRFRRPVAGASSVADSVTANADIATKRPVILTIHEFARYPLTHVRRDSWERLSRGESLGRLHRRHRPRRLQQFGSVVIGQRARGNAHRAVVQSGRRSHRDPLANEHILPVRGSPCSPQSRTERRGSRHSNRVQNRRYVLPRARAASGIERTAPRSRPAALVQQYQTVRGRPDRVSRCDRRARCLVPDTYCSLRRPRSVSGLSISSR